jgi:hypothetical protein
MSRYIRFGFCGWSICGGKAELRTQGGCDGEEQGDW